MLIETRIQIVGPARAIGRPRNGLLGTSGAGNLSTCIRGSTADAPHFYTTQQWLGELPMIRVADPSIAAVDNKRPVVSLNLLV